MIFWNHPVTPHSTMSAELAMKMPIDWEMPTPLRLVASSAAPGVDQAVSTGARQMSDSVTQVTPMPMPRAHIHEASWAASAPAALAAWKMMATELVYPTSTAMNPEETEEGRNQSAR